MKKLVLILSIALSLLLPTQGMAYRLVYGQHSILHAENGSASVPTYSFLSDPDSGFYRSAANEVSLSLGGTQKYVFGASSFSIPANITAGSGTGITVNNAGSVNRQVYQVTTTYAAYSDTDTKKGIVIATLPAKMKIVGCYSDTTTKYTGGAVSAATLRVGITSEDAAEIIAEHDVFTNPVTKGLDDADMGTSMTRAAAIQGGYVPSWTGTTAIYATINTTNGNTNALTAGLTTFYIVTEQY